MAFDPGARPALLVAGNLLLAAAVGTDGSLRATTIDPVTRTVSAPIEVDASVAIATFGPVALGLTAANVVALAVDTQGVMRAATRPFAGGTWTPLIPVRSLIAISPLGGVTAVTHRHRSDGNRRRRGRDRMLGAFAGRLDLVAAGAATLR